MTTTALPRVMGFTWYRHRRAIAWIAGAFGLAIVAMVIYGMTYRLHAGLTYVGEGGLALEALPFAVAMFAGLPWLTREFETGNFRYTFVQGISPRRWLLGTFGSLAAVAVVGAALCSLVFVWWENVVTGPGTVGYGTIWDWQVTLDLGSLTLLAMAMALLAGVLIRRTVPAMAALGIGFSAYMLFGEDWLYLKLQTIGPVVSQVRTSISPPYLNDLFVRDWFTGPGGQPVSTEAAYRLVPVTQHAQADSIAWLTRHGYTYWVAHQPNDHLVLISLAWTAILVLASAAAVLAASRLLRPTHAVRRPAHGGRR